MGTGRSSIIRIVVGVFAAMLTLAPAMPAAAENLFQSLFGELDRALQGRPERLPDHVPAFAEPFGNFGRAAPPSMRAEFSPAKAFCVRTCDGHFFPVRAQPGMSTAEACRAFCPASETRLYSGGTIDYAVGRDGSRYADLPNAFVYRKHLVAGCTCNGRDAFGLAHIDVTTDPTLKPGDVVATRAGLVAYTGHTDRTANFTPVESYPGFTKSYRDQLSALRIMPPISGAPNATPVKLPLPAGEARDDHRQSAQR